MRNFVTLAITFFTLCFISLCVFLWVWRVELIENTFDSSLKNVSTKISSITATSPTSYTLHDVEFRSSTCPSPIQIEEIRVELRTKDFLFWLLLPVRNPLIITQATLLVKNVPFIPVASYPGKELLIKERTVIFPEGSSASLGERKGSLGSLLSDTLNNK